MELIGGFAWPVPRAFAGAVSACRFEQGDVLYSDAASYEAWSGAGRGDWIQILDPPKSARAVGEGGGGRFLTNWASPALLDLTRAGQPEPETLETTQGRLFSCLWRGDLAALRRDGPDPEPPVMQRELHRLLEQAVPAMRRRLGKKKGGAGSLYLGVLDEAGDASRVKAQAIRGVLAGAFEIAHAALSPEAAGIEEPGRFHPALRVEGIAIRAKRGGAAGEAGAVQSVLKDLLYTPAEGKTDRFSLSRHGLLVPLVAED